MVQGVGVLIAGVLIWASGNQREWFIADPICTFVFAVIVIATTLTVLRDAIHVLMEGRTHRAALRADYTLDSLTGLFARDAQPTP